MAKSKKSPIVTPKQKKNEVSDATTPSSLRSKKAPIAKVGAKNSSAKKNAPKGPKHGKVKKTNSVKKTKKPEVAKPEPAVTSARSPKKRKAKEDVLPARPVSSVSEKKRSKKYVSRKSKDDVESEDDGLVFFAPVLDPKTKKAELKPLQPVEPDPNLVGKFATAMASESENSEDEEGNAKEGPQADALGNAGEGPQADALGNAGEGPQLDASGNAGGGPQADALGNVGEGPQLDALGNAEKDEGAPRKSQLPIHVDLTRRDAKEQMLRAIQRTYLAIKERMGCSAVLVGMSNQPTKHILENAQRVLDCLRTEFPGGWDNIRNIQVRREGVKLSGPVYYSLASGNKVHVVDFREREKPLVVGEVSTVTNGLVAIKPEGEVFVVKEPKKEKKEDDDEEDSD
ncbi:unnamed protein product [Cyprideis torosa]|uniref:Uncharacterized protein n=1 Tax=Cyprideis torosa TaxID=163714 RepID=A0A7R8W8Y8_9CRUS|nr:unnamed protein product [Cyprideis torosa]CAG0889156.1 unnamed protein product [Cyprideis torosa]